MVKKSIAETVKSRSPYLQLYIEVSNVFHILFTSINNQSKLIQLMYYGSIVCSTNTTFLAMHLVISSKVYDEYMV